MKIKKINILVISIIILTCATVFALTSCKTYIDTVEGFEIIKKAYQGSIDDDIFYWKEYNNAEKIANGDIELTRVNVHCDADNNGLIYENGIYKNYAIRVEKLLDGKRQWEKYCGESESSTGKATLPHLIDMKYDQGKHVSSTKTQMNAFEYFASDEFAEYRLDSKLAELKDLIIDDFDFSVKDGGIYKNGAVIMLKARVKDSYLDAYEESNDAESLFKGEMIDIEVTYDRISKLVVYQLEDLGGGLTNTFETYKLEIVYLGKNIDVPSYDDPDMKYIN